MLSGDSSEAKRPTNDHILLRKKRRLQRACDSCRQKKIKCEPLGDGHQSFDSSSSCSSCTKLGLLCTYVEGTMRTDGLERRVESLENEVEKHRNEVEKHKNEAEKYNNEAEKYKKEAEKYKEKLNQLLRKKSLTNEPLKDLDRYQESSQTQMSAVKYLPYHALSFPPQSVGTSSHPMGGPRFREEKNENSAHHLLALHDDPRSGNPSQYYYNGKSSHLMLVKSTMEFKQKCTANAKASTRGAAKGRRLEHWKLRPWESPSAVCDPPYFEFPPDDLLPRLVNLYFEQVNLLFPLLHRPSFERSIAMGLHYSDHWFGAVVLLVCAVGSQYSDDPRVLIDGEESGTKHSSGWKFFQQVKLTVMRRDDAGPCSIYNLQIYCLAASYMQNRTAYESCWNMLATAIRLAIHGGIHVRWKADTEPWTLEDELKTRAFWMLVFMDIAMSCAMGRPCIVQFKDFDLDYPLDVDDEHLERACPKQSFKQLQMMPSLVASFIALLKLYQVRALILQEIYCVRNTLGPARDEQKRQITTELTSRLNDWEKSLPEHLRWDPNRKNEDHFKQSVLLYNGFHEAQILIYMPFISSPRKTYRYSFPSLSNCVRAARSCSNVLIAARKRVLGVLPFVQLQAFASGLILLLNFWSGKRPGMFADSEKDMMYVEECLHVLQVVEKRWDSAGRLCDVLSELLPERDSSPADPGPSSSLKKQRQLIYQGLKPGSSAGGVSRETVEHDFGRRIPSLSFTQSKVQYNQSCQQLSSTSPLSVSGNNPPYTASIVPYLDSVSSQWNPPSFSHVDTDAANYATGISNTEPSLLTRISESQNQVQDWPKFKTIKADESNTFGAFSSRPNVSSSLLDWSGVDYQQSPQQSQLVQPQPRTYAQNPTLTTSTGPSYNRMPESQYQVQDWTISETINANESNMFGTFSSRPSCSSSLSGWDGVDYSEMSPQRSLPQPLLEPQPRTSLAMLQAWHQLAPQSRNNTFDYGFRIPHQDG